MLSSKLNSPAQFLRDQAASGAPLNPRACGLLADILEDIRDRVAVIEHQPVPPSARVIPMRIAA